MEFVLEVVRFNKPQGGRHVPEAVLRELRGLGLVADAQELRSTKPPAARESTGGEAPRRSTPAQPQPQQPQPQPLRERNKRESPPADEGSSSSKRKGKKRRRQLEQQAPQQQAQVQAQQQAQQQAQPPPPPPSPPPHGETVWRSEVRGKDDKVGAALLADMDRVFQSQWTGAPHVREALSIGEDGQQVYDYLFTLYDPFGNACGFRTIKWAPFLGAWIMENGCVAQKGNGDGSQLLLSMPSAGVSRCS